MTRRAIALVSCWVALGWATAFEPSPAHGEEIEIREKPPRFQRADDGEVIPVVVVVDGATIRRAPSRAAASAGRAKYLTSYSLIDSVDEYYLAGVMDDAWEAPAKIVGWFHRDDVLIERQAIREKKGIFLKGIVINQWREAGAGGVSIQGAELLQGPGEDFETVGEIGLFSFYFIYKKHERPGARYYLLGGSPILGNVLRPGETLEGWVDAARLVEWPTRQAIQFDKDTLAQRVGSGTGEGVRIFPSEHEVLADLRGEGSLAGETLEPVAVEDVRVKRWQHNWPRFPLFETRRNLEMPAAGALYNVGFIGDQIYVGGKAGATRGRVAENLEKVEKLRTDLKGIDLLFVIDSTGSMRQYFASAADAVLEIASAVRAEFPVADGEGPEIRFSVVFYRDYVDEDGQPNPDDTYLTKRLPFTGNQARVASFLRDEQQSLCDGCGGDEPEAMFWGLDYAISTAAKEVSGQAGLRAVVLMGDKGNHLRDPRRLDAAKVATALENQRYDFFCFHVVEASWLEKDPETRAFREQCADIGRRVETSTRTERVTSRRPSDIASAIVDAARALGEDLEKTREATRKVARGEAGLVDIRRQYGVRLTKRLTDMMEERGVDPSIFVEQSAQVFDRGWVAENDPIADVRQIEEVLLVDRATLEQLQGLLAGLTKEPPSKKNVESLWAKVLKDITQGEAEVDKTVAELIEGHLGIPVRKKLLTKTLREIANLDPKQLHQLYSELQLDLHRIRGLQAEKELEIRRIPTGDGGFRVDVKETGTRAVWWQGKGREYAWIPLDELP